MTVVGTSAGTYTFVDGSADNSADGDNTTMNGYGMTTGTYPNYTGSIQANYVDIPVPAGGAGSFTVSLAEPVESPTAGNGNPGITAIEIVPNGPVGVPEPSSIALLLLAAVPVGFRFARRRRGA